MNQPQTFSIGRAGSCDIALADTSVSAQHAELTLLDTGQLLLTDRKSTNGTFLIDGNGQPRRIRQELVTVFDRVRFGTVNLGIRDLLDALHSKIPVRLLPFMPEGKSSLVQGRQLIRCHCGCVKPIGVPCPECGQ